MTQDSAFIATARTPASLARRCAAFWSVLLLLLLASASVSAQALHAFGHQVWSTEEGLPQNSVHQVLQARDGYLWIATEGGLARFDGFSFTVFRREDDPAFPSDDIACLAEARDGSLWIGTTGGLLHYAAGHFSRVALGGDPAQQSVLALAAASDGSTLALTVGGVLRIADGRASPLPNAPTAPVQALAPSPDGTVWLATDSGLLPFRAGRLLAGTALNEAPLGLSVDRSGTVWVRGAHGIFPVPATTGVVPLTAPDLPPGLINTFLRDSAGRLWIGTSHGLFLKDSSTAPSARVEQIGLRSILSLTEDREGSVWVGTEADGLHILRSQKFEARPELSDHAISALAQTTDGSVWIGTRDDGLLVSHPLADGSVGPAVQPAVSHSLASEVILALAAGLHGDLWVGTLDGLDHIEGGAVERFSSADGLPDDVIRSLLVDADSSLWIGTRRGLVHWAGRRGSSFTRIEGLPSDLIGAMLRSRSSLGPPPSPPGIFGLSRLPDSGPLWVATLAGLSRLANGVVTRNEAFGDASGAAVITSLAEDRAGTLWVGSQASGLAALLPDGLHRIASPAIPSRINSLLTDAAGSLWIGSARGIFRVAADDLTKCLADPGRVPAVAHFGFADGMPTEETTSSGHPTALRTADGRLWFATTRGVAILDPAHLHQNPVPPPVVIERFLADAGDKLRSPAPYTLPYGRGGVTFDYVGLSFLAPSRVRYRYLLEGFDREWTEAGSRRSAFYTNLPPGRYTFRVQAANNDGVWNRQGASLSFSILPPFYRRLWFYALLLLALATLAYAVYYLRVRRLRSEFAAVLAERNRIAREIHDTLAQNFVGISIHLQLADQLLGAHDLPGTSRQLEQTRALVQEGLNDARQSIWELRASVAQDSLPTRLTRAVERVERAADPGANPKAAAAQVRITGIYRPLEAAVENEILRIAGEALANIVRHARATEIKVTLGYGTDRLQLTIADNGVGFDPDAVGSTGDHFGLEGMRERTASLGATLSVVSSPNIGTTITLAVPLPRAERRNP